MLDSFLSRGHFSLSLSLCVFSLRVLPSYIIYSSAPTQNDVNSRRIIAGEGQGEERFLTLLLCCITLRSNRVLIRDLSPSLHLFRLRRSNFPRYSGDCTISARSNRNYYPKGAREWERLAIGGGLGNCGEPDIFVFALVRLISRDASRRISPSFIITYTYTSADTCDSGFLLTAARFRKPL